MSQQRVKQVSRRVFLAQAAAGAGVAMAGRAAAQAAGQGRVPGANERISIGIIGTGDRGRDALMAQIIQLADQQNVEITAVCDVWKPNLNKAVALAEKKFGRQPRTFTRFGDLLALEDVDAVTIATPDFGHNAIMNAALRAGKDVYVEKPMSMDVNEANEALDLARKNQRIVQVGTQRRSEGNFKAAAKEIASGVLGTVSRVSCSVNVNHPRWARAYEDCKAQDVDWEAYLFNRPQRPFDPKLLRRWHLYSLCTNGLSGLWMAHYSDAVNMIMGTKYPSTVVAHGGKYVWKDDREIEDTLSALLDFPEGFLMNWGMGLGNSSGQHFTVHGTKGTLDAERWTVAMEGSKEKPRKIQPEQSNSHMGNWLECLRTRQRPIADIEFGHQHAVATIMAAAAFHSGRRQVYDAEKRTITAG